MRIVVRNEEEKDYRRVEEITRLAFSYPGRIEQGQIGCPYEHWMVHELRKRDGILPLSLVAEADGVLAGHVICSHAQVRLPEESCLSSDASVTKDAAIPVLNFGPISVLPEYQRQGVGKALLEAMIQRAAELGYGAFLFFGRPEYYPQFGFKEAAVFGITDCNGANYPAFMAMELKPGYLDAARGGKYYESDIFDDERNREKVKAFDEAFFAGAHRGL